MRRREYLRSALGSTGLAGLAATAPAAAGHGWTGADAGNGTSETSNTPSSGVDGTNGGDGASETSIAPLSRVDVTNDGDGLQAAEAVTTPDGRYAFVSKLDGFHVVDVADPASPTVVATREDILDDAGEPMRDIKDIKYDGGRLLAASDTRGSSFTGIAVFDVSDPTDPTLSTSYETDYAIHNGDLAGDYAYLTTGESLDVVDVATDEPESVAEWSVVDYDDAYADVDWFLRNLHDVYVQGERAYLAYWDAGTWILDVSDPENPTHVGHAAEYTAEELAAIDSSNVIEHGYEPPGNVHSVQPNDDGTLLAVGKESWDVTPEDDAGGPGGITLWDLSDPSDPTELSTIDAPATPEGESAARNGGYWTTAHNFDIDDDYLYSSWYRAGVKVHDVSDPANPRELGAWGSDADTSFWTARVAVPGECFVGASHGRLPDGVVPGGLFVFPDPRPDSAATPDGSGDATAATDTSTAKTATTSSTATDSPTPTAAAGTSTATPSRTTADGASDESGAGFGPTAALAGIGIGAWRLLSGGNE